MALIYSGLCGLGALLQSAAAKLFAFLIYFFSWNSFAIFVSEIILLWKLWAAVLGFSILDGLSFPALFKCKGWLLLLLAYQVFLASLLVLWWWFNLFFWVRSLSVAFSWSIPKPNKFVPLSLGSITWSDNTEPRFFLCGLPVTITNLCCYLSLFYT